MFTFLFLNIYFLLASDVAPAMRNTYRIIESFQLEETSKITNTTNLMENAFNKSFNSYLLISVQLSWGGSVQFKTPRIRHLHVGD